MKNYLVVQYSHSLRSISKTLGISVFVIPCHDEIVQGLAWAGDKPMVNIWCSPRNINSVSFVFTLLHELGHYALGHLFAGSDVSPLQAEVEAEEFALMHIRHELPFVYNYCKRNSRDYIEHCKNVLKLEGEKRV